MIVKKKLCVEICLLFAYWKKKTPCKSETYRVFFVVDRGNQPYFYKKARETKVVEYQCFIFFPLSLIFTFLTLFC